GTTSARGWWDCPRSPECAPSRNARLRAQRQDEGAALAELARNADFAADQRRQFLAQVQAEPGAFLAPGDRAVDAGEGGEQLGAVLRADADAGISDGDLGAVQAVAARAAHFDRDF